MRRVTTLGQLDTFLAMSSDTPVFLFKHSTTCPISAQAFEQVKKFSENAHGIPCGIIHVIEERPVSNAVAQRTGIQHESPQVFFIKDGQVLWHESHSAITTDALREAAAVLA